MTAVETAPASPRTTGAGPGTSAGRPSGAAARGVVMVPGRWPAELAVVALTSATAASFWRVFVGWRFLAVLLAAAFASHLVAWGCRRLRLPIFAAAPVSVAAASVYAGLAWYRSTTRFGVPTARTLTAVRVDLKTSLTQFGTAVPPVVARGGFLVAAALGLWLTAFLADSLAFRAMAGVEAVLPASLGFTLTSAVGANRMRLAATALWLVTAVVTVALLRALRASTAGAWLAGRSRSFAGAARWAAVAGVAVAAIGVFGGSRVPGYGKQPLISTHNQVATDHIVVSPFVDLKPRLSRRTPAPAFTVKADSRSYLRLTTLDEFDGRRWQSPTRDYQKVAGPLESTSAPANSTASTVTITISGLTNEFVPAPATPTTVVAKRKLAWEPDLQSLILPNGGKLKKGDTFTITSIRPANVTADQLRAASRQIPQDIAARYLDLPSGARRAVGALAREQTSKAPTTYDQMRALQDYFQISGGYTYSLDVPAGNGLSAIDAFLKAKQGYCEQYAATFAAMARSLGVPARVAVGFTYGIRQPDGTYLVQDKHAHAWPEIYFDGYGWMPFEPTPGRGNPDAEQITGIPTQQADEKPVVGGNSPIDRSVSIPTLPAVAPTFRGEASTIPGSATTVRVDNGPAVPAPVAWFLGIVGALAAALGLWLGMIRWVTARRWRKRTAAATTPARQVLLAWHRAVDALERSGARVSASETATQVAARLARRPGVPGEMLDRLAQLATVAGFSGVDLDPALATEAATLAATIRTRTAATLRPRSRWGLRVDPRPLWRPLPGDRHGRATHDLVTTVDAV